MCGIVGFIGSYNEQILNDMNQTIQHRGPDGSGSFHSQIGEIGYVGLAMQRLNIIDLEGGKQPIWNEDGTCVIVFNGEIYNYQILRKQLISLGHQFSTQSDTEVILHGYEQYGEAVLDHLEGMFAFAIWDKVRQKLFLARDRLGIKPLYYAIQENGVLLFGSEIKALFPALSKRMINKEALYHYLLFGFILSGSSIFEGVTHLPPGHYLIWEDGNIRISRYWKIERQDYGFSDFEEWRTAIRQTLYDAVESHLIADIPVGLTLSGGLDSSSILALMSQIKDGQEIMAHSLGYGRQDDELPFARRAAACYGANLQETFSSLSQVAEDYPQILFHLDEPLAHPVLGTTYHLSESLFGNLKVALIGEGSDELFAGYPHYRLFTPPFSFAPRPLRQTMFFKVAYLMPDEKAVKAMLSPDWLDEDLLRQVAHQYDSYFENGNHQGEAGLHCELEAELVGNQLLRIDKLMMAHSIEARVPFLDRAFVELAYSAPFNLKMKDGQEKYLLRHAMKDLLPEEITNRPKSGPKGTQALLDGLVDALTRRHGQLLDKAQLNHSGIFNGETLAQMIERPLGPIARGNPITVRQKPKLTLAVLTFQIWWKYVFEESIV